MKKFVIFHFYFFLTILIVSALTVTVSGVGELTPVNCVSVIPVSSGSRVHRYSPAQVRHYRDIYTVPLLLSLDQLSGCRDLGLVEKRKRKKEKKGQEEERVVGRNKDRCR